MPQYITEEILKEKYITTEIVEYKNNVVNSIPQPIVSVILITYQHKKYIESSINGILNQSLNCEWEFIIGDDESTDGTREICMRTAKKFPNKVRLFLHSQKNSRRILNKPSGILQITYNLLKARGKYIAICSGDDVWTDPLKLQKQLNLMINDDKTSLCYQSWCKVYQSVNGSLKRDEVNTSYPKASTTFYKNINSILPTQLLNVIQEDEFQYFILRGIGEFKITEDLSPVLVNSPTTSITNTLDLETKRLHVANLHENIFKSYWNTKYFLPALKLNLGYYKELIMRSDYKTFLNTFKFVVKSLVKLFTK